MSDTPVLLSTVELAEMIEQGRSPVILDVRWALGDRHGRDRFHEGHISGAVYVDLDEDLADPPAPGSAVIRCPTSTDSRPPHAGGDRRRCSGRRIRRQW